MTSSTRRAERIRRELAAAPVRPGATSALDLFGLASRTVRGRVPYEAAVWRAVDPMTGLMAFPVLVENLDEGGCSTYWHTELIAENINRFADLAQATSPVASLVAGTHNLTNRSAIFRDYMAPRGLTDELRAVLRVDGRTYGHISLFRGGGSAAFTEDDHQAVGAVAERLAVGVRRSYLASAPPNATGEPGVVLVDARNRVAWVSASARRHLRSIGGDGSDPANGQTAPPWFDALIVQTRAVALGLSEARPHIRFRSAAGAWIACYASLADPSDALGEVAVVIEGARHRDVLPLLLEAYGLTRRERQVAGMLTRGMPTAEVAHALTLSPHTIRDYVKSVYEKLGVSSRGELAVKLYDETEPDLSSSIIRILS